MLSEIRKYCGRAAIIREGKLIRTDTVENLTRTSAKHVRMIKDGKEEDFIYHGKVNELLRELAAHDVSDIVIEEPELEEVFMHFYDAKDEVK